MQLLTGKLEKLDVESRRNAEPELRTRQKEARAYQQFRHKDQQNQSFTLSQVVQKESPQFMMQAEMLKTAVNPRSSQGLPAPGTSLHWKPSLDAVSSRHY